MNGPLSPVVWADVLYQTQPKPRIIATHMAGKHRISKRRQRGCLFWFVILCVVIPSVLALAAIASPPVLLFGIVLTTVILADPERTGARVRAWAIWRRIPLLRTQTSAAGFVTVLLLYTVPVPALLTSALVAAAVQPNGAGQPPTASGRSADPGSQIGGTAPTSESPASPTPTPTPTQQPTPTAVPVVAAIPPATSTPRPVATATPLPPPASTCSASVKFPTPGDGGDQTVYVSSNVPSSAVTIAVHYKTTVHTFPGGTDAGGNAAITFSIGRPTPGYRVIVDVTAGNASCSTSFTPQ